MKLHNFLFISTLLLLVTPGCNMGNNTKSNITGESTEEINLNPKIISTNIAKSYWGNTSSLKPINILFFSNKYFLTWADGDYVKSISNTNLSCGNGSDIISAVNAGNGIWAYQDNSNNIYQMNNFICNPNNTINAGKINYIKNNQLSHHLLAIDGIGNIFYTYKHQNSGDIWIKKSPITNFSNTLNSWTIKKSYDETPLLLDLDSSGNLLYLTQATSNNSDITKVYYASLQNSLNFYTAINFTIQEASLVNIYSNSAQNSLMFWLGKNSDSLYYMNIGAQKNIYKYIFDFEKILANQEQITAFKVNDSNQEIYIGTDKGNIYVIPYIADGSSMPNIILKINSSKNIIKYNTQDSSGIINIIHYDKFLKTVIAGSSNGSIYIVPNTTNDATSITKDLPSGNNSCNQITSSEYGVVENCLYNTHGSYFTSQYPWAKYVSVFAYGAGGGGGDYSYTGYRGGGGGDGFRINLVDYQINPTSSFEVFVGGGGAAGYKNAGAGGGYSALYRQDISKFILVAGGGGGGGYGDDGWGEKGGSASAGGSGKSYNDSIFYLDAPLNSGGYGASRSPNPSEDSHYYLAYGGYMGGGNSLRYHYGPADAGGGGGYGGGGGGYQERGGGAGGSYIDPSSAKTSIFIGAQNNGGAPSVGSANSTAGGDGYILIKYSQFPLYFNYH